jgi:hypothetical protein
MSTLVRLEPAAGGSIPNATFGFPDVGMVSCDSRPELDFTVDGYSAAPGLTAATDAARGPELIKAVTKCTTGEVVQYE